MNEVKEVSENWVAKIALSIAVISYLCLTHHYLIIQTHQSKEIFPPQENSLLIKQNLIIESSDADVSILRTLGHTLNDVTLWDTNYKNDKFIIRVQINNSYSIASKTKIKDALKNLQKRSKVIRFITSHSPPSNKNVPYIHIQQTQGGCWSWIGRTRNANTGQVLSLDEDSSCVNSGTIQHEILHALGFLHEHTRNDRNSYVNIYPNNIDDDSKRNFWKDKNGDTLGSDYDLGSVMHYGEKSSSKNGKKTMEAKVNFKLNL